MGPDSKFLTELNRGGKNIDKYKIIIGDTSLITVEHAKGDNFLEKKLKMVKEKGHYVALNVFIFNDVHNDMAVRVESMRKIYDLNSTDNLEDKIFKVPSDHISYFHNSESVSQLEKLISEVVTS